mgnify:FL=1
MLCPKETPTADSLGQMAGMNFKTRFKTDSGERIPVQDLSIH